MHANVNSNAEYEIISKLPPPLPQDREIYTGAHNFIFEFSCTTMLEIVYLVV